MKQQQKSISALLSEPTKRKPGRPVVPNSKHHLKVVETETKRTLGLIKLGRPVSSTSESARRAEQAAIKEALGINKPGYNRFKLAKMGIKFHIA